MQDDKQTLPVEERAKPVEKPAKPDEDEAKPDSILSLDEPFPCSKRPFSPPSEGQGEALSCAAAELAFANACACCVLTDLLLSDCIVVLLF